MSGNDRATGGPSDPNRREGMRINCQFLLDSHEDETALLRTGRERAVAGLTEIAQRYGLLLDEQAVLLERRTPDEGDASVLLRYSGFAYPPGSVPE